MRSPAHPQSPPGFGFAAGGGVVAAAGGGLAPAGGTIAPGGGFRPGFGFVTATVADAESVGALLATATAEGGGSAVVDAATWGGLDALGLALALALAAVASPLSPDFITSTSAVIAPSATTIAAAATMSIVLLFAFGSGAIEPPKGSAGESNDPNGAAGAKSGAASSGVPFDVAAAARESA